MEKEEKKHTLAVVQQFSSPLEAQNAQKKMYPTSVYGSACSNVRFNDVSQAFGSYINTCSRAKSLVSV